MSIILPLFLGILFGFALNKAGLTRYTKIVNQFRLTDMAVLKFMMTAPVVVMLGLFPLKMLGVINFPIVPATYGLATVGGLIFGGMSLAGLPGTAAAGAGEGKLDYLVPGVLGFLAGALVYGLTYDKVFLKISAIANYGTDPARPLAHQSHCCCRIQHHGPGPFLHDRSHGLAAQGKEHRQR
jgi:hypothetical protein